jgi:YgiT-type zinc finger domain-containing protein
VRCLICRQAEIVLGLTSVTFERGEFRIVVNNVPALICPKCRDAYVDEHVAMSLLRQAEAVSAEGAMDATVEYEK